MIRHFVTFYSPGTFMSEDTTKEIGSWDVEEAMRMASEIVERYGAVPYAFQFKTMERGDEDFSPKFKEKSPMHFINCVALTLEEIEAKNDPQDRILIENMKCNGYKRVVQTVTGWSWTQPLGDNDIVHPPSEVLTAAIAKAQEKRK